MVLPSLRKLHEESSLSYFQGGGSQGIKKVKKKKWTPNEGKIILTIKWQTDKIKLPVEVCPQSAANSSHCGTETVLPLQWLTPRKAALMPSPIINSTMKKTWHNIFFPTFLLQTNGKTLGN